MSPIAVVAALPPSWSGAQVVFTSAGLPRALVTALRRRHVSEPVVALDPLGHLPVSVLISALAPDWTSALAMRRRCGVIGRALLATKQDTVALLLPAAVTLAALEAIVLGLTQGMYAWDRYLPAKATRLRRLVLVHPGADAAWQRPAQLALHAAACVAECRDQVNTPAEDCGPDHIEAAARAWARAAGLKLTLHDEAACRRLKLGALLAVGRASHRAPRLLVLDWPGTSSGRAKPLALCGKGVCFDTGGLDLKTAKGMELMRKDMGGAATVLAAMRILAARRCPRPVRAYLPLVENAVGPDAMRPGDVLTAGDGTTIEVGNTDAEGRLILADAMVQARRDGAAGLVTVATLTGAALVALGRIHVPLMGTHDGLVGAIETAARATGEKVWRLPLDDEHRAKVRGIAATLTNDGDGEAGCITAGAFLAHFAKGLPFAHLDISPMCWMTRPHDLGPVGATGVMVSTLVAAVEAWR